MKNNKYSVGVVGATGLVGRTILDELLKRKFPIDQLKCFASKNSVGKGISFGRYECVVQPLSKESLKNLDFVFFAAGGNVSKKWAKIAEKNGTWVIDNSSVFRLKKDIPLILPEVNGSLLQKKKSSKLIANPNCTTAILCMGLKPIHDLYKIKRVIVSTYQAVSGKGQSALEELRTQRSEVIKNKKTKPKVFPYSIVHSCIPQVDVFLPNGITGEEYKVVEETKKILNLPKLKVIATCVRIPIENAHSESVYVETEKPIDLKKIKSALKSFPGLLLKDNPLKSEYPLAEKVSGTSNVEIGRIRLIEDTDRKGLCFWIVGDNLRRGAAQNAVQIAEEILSIHCS